MSAEERREHIRPTLERNVKKYKKCPDVTVNQAVVMFCSASSDSLQQHLNRRKQVSYPVASWMSKLAEKLANLSPNPKLAGLGALAVAIFIDAISATSSSDTTRDALRCVFAEEKASEVWDQIDECLKRCVMHIDNNNELMTDIRRTECQLSAALTKLKNSMARDGQMSSRALKAWVNGAALHIQMLIHLLRLGGSQSCDPVQRLLSTYLSELDLLFTNHKAAVRRKCDLDCDVLQDCPCPYFETEEGEAYYVAQFITFEEYFEAYYDYHYSSQKFKIRKYFEKVMEDLPMLVRQVGHLSVS